MTGIIIAFKHLNFAKGILHSDWAGLSNFKYLFGVALTYLISLILNICLKHRMQH